MDDELLTEFINECREHLSTIEADLLAIEEGEANIDEALINKVFRAAHSIKGGSGFFGLDKVKELAHKAETVLDMLRFRKMSPNAEIMNVLLAAFDRLRDMINHTDTSEQVDISDLVAGLSSLTSSYLSSEQKSSLHTQVVFKKSGGGDPASLPQTDIDRVMRKGQFIYWIDCDLIHDIENKGQHILTLFNRLTKEGEILDCSIDMVAVGTLDGPVSNCVPLRLIIAVNRLPEQVGSLFETINPEQIHILLDPRTTQAKTSAEVVSEPASAPEPKPSTRPEVSMLPVRSDQTARKMDFIKKTSPQDDTLRVHVGLLERLMNLAGELVLSRNQLRAAVAQNNQELLNSADQRVNQVTSELQDVIMQTRLQSIGNVFSKFPRVVRDLSRRLGKDIELIIEGKDVALDKTLIEGLSDPLTHMVRNAVDHGIETVSERLNAGKKQTGIVQIKARYEAGQVVVEIIDDGKGLDLNRLTEAAVHKGLISEEKIRTMSDQDKRDLIFLPGLSTAPSVSDVSGRGVGMDVVKTNLGRLGGQVEIISEVGKGSTFRIKLPLTLAIIPSLIISEGNERFALPQANIEELLRLRTQEIESRIKVVGDHEILLLRDRILPLTRLSRIIESQSFLPDSTNSSQDSDKMEIAIISTGTLSFGLVVGAFHDTEEVVVKSLGRRLKTLYEYSGATILGDGAVALILDAAGIVAKAGLSSATGKEKLQDVLSDIHATYSQEMHTLLLFHNSPQEPCAIHLDLIQRIERIRPDQVQYLGGYRTMQYRGHTMPLITLSDAAKMEPIDGQKDLVVLVSNIGSHEVGILGIMPVDVIETQVAIDLTTHRQAGICGSAIINNHTILIVNLHELAERARPDLYIAQAKHALSKNTPGKQASVLLAEDSTFFRAQVKKYLEDDEFNVIDAPDGEAAWELLLKHLDNIQAVITDIEMPRLNGLELTNRIRSDQRTAALPVIAVSSLAGDEDIAKGLKAGVNDYLVKLDREKLLASLHGYTTDK